MHAHFVTTVPHQMIRNAASIVRTNLGSRIHLNFDIALLTSVIIRLLAMWTIGVYTSERSAVMIVKTGVAKNGAGRMAVKPRIYAFHQSVLFY